MDEGVSLLKLAQDAHSIFEKQEGMAQRKLLNFVVQNCIWKDGELIADFRQPFDMLQETALKSTNSENPEGYDDAGKENWLRFAREFRTLCLAPDRVLKEKLEAIRRDEFGWLRPTAI